MPNLMIRTSWLAVKQALLSEFGSAQTLINQKQVFMYIQMLSGKTAPAFVKRFYRKAQVLVTFGKPNLNDAVTATVS